MANIQTDDITNAAGTGPVGFSKGIVVVNSVNTVSNANYTITTTDGYEVILVVTGITTRTVTLPAVALSAGRLLTIKKTDSGAGLITITPNGGTIDGASSNTLNAQYSYVTIYCDGSNWNVVNAYDVLQTATAFTNQPTGAGNVYFDAATAGVTPGSWSMSGMVSFNRNSATVTSANVLAGYGTTTGNVAPNVTLGTGSAVMSNQQISSITAAGWTIINLPLPTIVLPNITTTTLHYLKGLTDAVSLGSIQYASWFSLVRFK